MSAAALAVLASACTSTADPSLHAGGAGRPPGTGDSAGCVGVPVPEASRHASPGPEQGGGEGGGAAGTGGNGGGAPLEDPLRHGAAAPAYWLTDFQPQSCGHRATYGLDAFNGHTTVVALLAGWCSYCQAQASKMEQMRLELKKEGRDVQFIAINSTTALDDQQALVDRCAFPLLQDVDSVKAWEIHHHGKKDDILVYDRRGALTDYFPSGAERSSNLSTPQGYENVRNAVETALSE